MREGKLRTVEVFYGPLGLNGAEKNLGHQDAGDTAAPYLALLLPTTYIAEGLRAAYYPDSPHMGAGTVLAGLSLAAVVLIPLADWVFRRRVRGFTW